jgi:adenylyltransferase/sulfurtransferase
LTDHCSPARDQLPSHDNHAGRYSVIESVAELACTDYSLIADRQVVVVGCGALGAAVAMHLVRGGVGAVRVIDRDVVELRNLAHQVLYSEDDAAQGRFKAEVAAERLRGLNSGCTVEGLVADFAPANARQLVRGADLILDCADNLETKLLINDVALATDTALVYAGCAGTEGSVLGVVPGITHCLRCLWPSPSPAAARLSCEMRGVLPMTVAAVAALQSTEAFKVLLGLATSSLSGLLRIDVWDGVLRRVPPPPFPPASRCPACGDRDFAYLKGQLGTTARELCGDDTVLLTVSGTTTDLEHLRRRHRGRTMTRSGPEHVELHIDGCRIVVFSSGKTLIHGAGGLNRAKALHARYIVG